MTTPHRREHVFGPRLRAADNAAPASWLSGAVDITRGTVGGLVPSRFECHVELASVPGGRDEWWAAQRAHVTELAAVLRGFTATPDVAWYGIWEGHDASWGTFAHLPRVALPARTYYLVTGDVADVSHLEDPTPPHHWRGPDLWWPDDRQWFAATDVDFWSVYVGGSRSLIDALVEHFPGLCRVVTTDDPLVAED